MTNEQRIAKDLADRVRDELLKAGDHGFQLAAVAGVERDYAIYLLSVLMNFTASFVARRTDLSAAEAGKIFARQVEAHRKSSPAPDHSRGQAPDRSQGQAKERPQSG
jgi:hypothetical protein